MPVTPLDIFYVGKNVKGELKGEVGYLGIKIGTPGRLAFGLNKNYIKIEEIEGSDINENENDFEFIFSIDKRDAQGFKKVLIDGRSILDHNAIDNPGNLEKLLKNLADKGYVRKEQIPQIIDSQNAQPLTAADVGKAVIVVDHSDEATAKDIKHKFISVWFDEEKGVGTGWVDNAEANQPNADLEGRLMFYVEKEHTEFFNNYIKSVVDNYVQNNPDKEYSPSTANTVLVDLGNEIIRGLQGFSDTATGNSLSLTKYASVPLAQHVYVAVKGIKELNPDTLITSAKNEMKADSTSLHSDSGVSSQSDASGVSEPSPLYPPLDSVEKQAETLSSNLGDSNLGSSEDVTGTPTEAEVQAQEEEQQRIETEKEAAKTAVNALKSWIEGKAELKEWMVGRNDNVGSLIRSLDKFLTIIKPDGTDLDAFASVKFVASTLKSYFHEQVIALDMENEWKNSVREWIDGNFIKISQEELEIEDVVSLISLTDNYIKKHEAFNEYNTYENKKNVLIEALVADPKLATAKEELVAVMNLWNNELKKFEGITEQGLFQAQKALSKIPELKASFKEKYKALETNNHAILQQKLKKEVAALKVSTASLQVKTDSKIEKERNHLLIKINALLAKLPTATLANGQIEGFQEQYNSMKVGLAAIKLSMVVSGVETKAQKLQEGNAAAKTKACKLFEIKNKVLAIESKISSGKVTEIKQAIGEAKGAIAANEKAISAYRSQWGSGFFFGTLLRRNLESRVTSKGLITALNSQLDNFERQLDVPPLVQCRA